MKVNKSTNIPVIIEPVKPVPLRRTKKFSISSKDIKEKTIEEIYNMMSQQTKGK